MEIVIDPEFYRCPNCGKWNARPIREKKTRRIRRCKNCEKLVNMETKGEQANE